jgi:hypothetical protein
MTLITAARKFSHFPFYLEEKSKIGMTTKEKMRRQLLS